MSTNGSGTSEPPNVVTPQAAARIRLVVYAKRDQLAINTREFVEELLEDGQGGQFDKGIQSARVLTWVKQVFRRLRKHGWLVPRTAEKWTPTEALRRCPNVQALARRVPRELRDLPEQPTTEAVAGSPGAPEQLSRPADLRPDYAPAESAPPGAETRSAPVNPEPVSTLAMDADVSATLATLRRKHAAAAKQAELYSRMIHELEALAGVSGGSAPPCGANGCGDATDRAEELGGKQEDPSAEVRSPCYTHPRKRAMLAALARTGNVSASARAAGIFRGTHYDWIRSDKEYEAAVKAAMEHAADFIEERAMKRVTKDSGTS